jgi:hypothetical protein
MEMGENVFISDRMNLQIFTWQPCKNFLL